VKSPFHTGELEMQRRAGVLDQARKVGRSIGSGLPKGVGPFLARQRLAVASSVDRAGRIWASLLTGPAGFLDAVDSQLLRLATRPLPGDPLTDDIATRPEIGLLALDPLTRQRMRFNGRGLLSDEGLFLLVEQAYGNCSKYIQRRRQEPDAEPREAPATPRVSSSLDPGQSAAIARADTFFIASFHPGGGADASHRGGFPGFVRVLRPDRLAFDDYPGNSMFNTLGNLVEYPSAGLLFVDFGNGDVLQLTGRPEVRPDFSVEVHVDEVREMPGASPLRFSFVEYSPSNPALSREPPSGISRAEPEGNG
jgi:predicted pyridoxine 5'-phosphate oxidase superfamily flavin-nucleotide-binding protein